MANAVSPTKANLMAAKKSLALAKNGYELLDRKRNILIRETMTFADAAKEIQAEIGQVFEKAYQSLMLANVTLGDCSQLAEAIPVEQGLTLQTRSVMGVEIPTVTLTPMAVENSYGFSSSNSYLDDACFQFARVKELTAKLAQIESSVTRLGAAISKTGKRANALKNIVIPRYEQQIAYMNEALEEKELEEHSRLKMIKKIQK
jgi:V/A-type H+-transporting ATPase subunit D